MASLLRLGGARVLCAAAKTSTGIVGLSVVPDARNVLIGLSSKLLKDVQTLPESAHYRQAVEKTYQHRLEVCKAHAEVETIEAVIGQGQIEELIRMARDEERLIPKMSGESTAVPGETRPK